MRPRVLIFFSISFVIVASALVAAQKAPEKPPQKPASQPGPDDQVKVGVYEVELPIIVKEKGRFVTGLRKENFEIYEDGKRQQIETFLAPSNLPLDVAVLMDTSNSVKLKLPFEKDAAEDFVATVTTYRRKDQVSFVTFDSAVELHQDFTDNQQLLVNAIRKVKAGGYTRLYDAVHRVIEEKLANVKRGEARRIIVILSDGEDTASEHSLKDAIEIAQRYDVTIFGISTKNFTGVGSGMVENADDKELRRLCEETGGQLFLPSQKLELFKSFTQVAQDVRQEYVVYYRPIVQQETHQRREIRVKLVGADGHLAFKTGYTH
jgi:Ca-activated chloride channel family protein